MPSPKIKDDKIEVILSNAQKKQVKLLAKMSDKSMSQYLLDAGLSLTLDTTKINFYQGIDSDLLFLKRQNYITSELVLLLVNDQYKDIEVVRKYYKVAEE